MAEIFLIDTDALLGLTHSEVGQKYLKGSNKLRLTDAVYDELTGPRKADPATKPMATVAESLINQNDSLEPVSQDSVDSIDGGSGYGEQSIQDYIIFGEHDVAAVFFFDDDMDAIIENLASDTEFFVVSKVVTFSTFGLSQERQIEEVLKMAKGRGWTARQNLYDLLVETRILSRSEFNYSSLKKQIRDEVSSDL